MGDRGNIAIKQDARIDKGKMVYLYTHWGGSGVCKDLAIALDRGRDQWENESHLTRIIFCQMVSNSDDLKGVRGYGISTYETDNEHPIPVVDCEKQIIRLTNNGQCTLELSFEEWIEKYKE